MWSDMVRVALIGTQREAVPTPTGELAVTGLLQQIDTIDPERALLKMAGAAFLYEQAGLQPTQFAPPNPISRAKPQTQKPTLSAKSGRYLRILVAGTYGDILPEFLHQMHALQLAVPAELLPDLLDRSMRVARFRPYALDILDAEGHWLAAQNHKWRFAAPISADWDVILREWKAGKTAEQHNILRRLRLREPQLGRELLEAFWSQMPDKGRVGYLKLLLGNLSHEDEPFLETALNDRNAAVRRKAAEFLSQLPNSRFCARMQANTEGILQWRPQTEQKIILVFPPTLSAEMIRDGISTKKAKDMARVREGQIKHMVGAVALDTWTDAWEKSAEEILQAVLTSNWTRTLTAAFSTATRRQGNSEWAQAFFKVIGFTVSTFPLVALLSEAEFEQILQQALDNSLGDPLGKNGPLLRMLTHWQEPLTPVMLQIYLKALTKHIELATPKAALTPMMRRLVSRLALMIPVDQIELVEATIDPIILGTQWRAAWRTMVAKLHFRRAMLASLNHDKAEIG